MSEEIRPGRYRHFKGKEYEVLGVPRPTRDKRNTYSSFMTLAF